jgi:glycosyltransferase involved in cell wall biosynthesis
VQALTPTISVILPTYNRAHVLSRAIESILSQTYRDFEFIIVDTAKMVGSLNRPEIRLLRHSCNRGQNPALNTGIKASKGKFCAFLDSDDEWHPDFLYRVMACFEREPELGCVYTWANIIDAATGKIDVAMRFTAKGNIYPEALSQGYVSHMITLVAKRDILFQVGLFDEDFEVCQDDDICIRLAKGAVFGLIPEPLAIIHQGAGNQVTRNQEKYADGAWRLTVKFADEMVTHCGKSALSWHYERCGDLFWLANNYAMALDSYRRAGALSSSIRICLKRLGVNLRIGPVTAVMIKRFCSKLTMGKT